MPNKELPLFNIQYRLLLIVIILNMIVFCIAGFSSYTSWSRSNKSAEISVQNLASVLERNIAGEMASIDIALLAVKHEAERELGQGGITSDSISAFLAEQHSSLPQLQGMRMTDSKGNVLYGTGGVVLGRPANIADRDYFNYARENPEGMLFVSKPVFGRVAKQWVFNLSRRINNPDGSFAGVVYAALPLASYVSLFSTVDVGKKGTVTLRDADLSVVVRYPVLRDLGSTIGNKRVVKELPRLIKGGKTFGTFKGSSGVDGVERLFSFRKIADFPLYIIVAVAKDEYLSDWRRESYTYVVFSLLFTMVTIFFSRKLLTRWQQAKESQAELRKAKEELEIRVEKRTEDLNTANELLKTELEERKQTEQALQDSRQNLINIIDFLPDATFVLDIHKKVIAWNRAMEKMTGIDKEDMIGQGNYAYTIPFYGERCRQLLDLLDVDDDQLKARYDNVTRKGNTLYAEIFAPALYEGKGANLWVIGAPLYDGDGKRVGSIESIRDITDKKHAEEQRNNDVALIESLLLNSPAGIRVFDAQSGECLLVNEAAAKIAGGPREDLLAQNFRCLESWQTSGLLDLADQVVADGVPRTHETHLHSSFGREVPVVYQFSRFIVRNRLNLLVVGRDVSEEKKLAEEKRLIEAQMLHAQKLESLGVLAGGIAHDFNNILSSIIGNADLALRRLNPESPVVDNLQRIEQAADRASELARQMLAYSGRGQFIIESIDLNRLVEEMLHMLEVSISKKAVLRMNLHRSLPTVDADATQLRQIIMNLVINASEAIGEKSGVIAITSGCMECDENYLKDVWLNENLLGGLYVYLEVTDTGCGMDKNTMERIFDPFFTTKFTGRGLGMAAVLGIVRGHKGTIKIYSEMGKGTSFKVLLPATGKPEELFNGVTGNGSWKGTGTVLLVDDEETLRSLGSEMLRELGFDVVTAEDGRRAVEIFSERPDIDFVLLDLTMPHMDGEQTFRELRKMKPDVKVIMSSGYTEQEVTQRFIGKGLAGFIQKPYKLSTLQDAFRDL